MSKFRPKKSSSRKVLSLGQINMNAAERAVQFGLDYNFAHMKLNEINFKFDPESGNWSDGSKSNQKQGKTFSESTNNSEQQITASQRMLEENNLLKIKNELLIDMLAEVYSEFNLQT